MARYASPLAVIAAVAVDPAAAFAPPAATAGDPAIAATPRPTTAVNLVPEQGRQLVAFSQDYLAKKAKESASKASNLHQSSRRAPGRKPGAIGSLVTRLLHRDGTSRRELMEEELNPAHHDNHEVLYPIVGFNLVDGHAVPSPGQRPACALHEETGEEVPYGYWSPQGGDGLWI